jgi:secondary thiamine-phosphate synthase enzyme
MVVATIPLRFSTRGDADIKDITNAVEAAVRQSDIKNGIATVFCPSSTSAVSTIEYESGCLSDLRRLFDEIIDPKRKYSHNARWGDGNGHSHVRASLLGPSLTVPFQDGKLSLGTWQQIIFVDFDNRTRDRELIVQVLGE